VSIRAMMLALTWNALAFGVEPALEDQAAIQEVFHRFMRGANECNEGLRGSAKVSEPDPFSRLIGLGMPSFGKQLPDKVCRNSNIAKIEIAAILP